MAIERALVVGYGSIGRRHHAALQRLLPEAEIALLRHRRPEPGAEQAIEFHEMADALAFRPEVAVIANPASFHLSAALPLARAGVHVLVEKPLSQQTDGVSALIEAAEAAGLVLMTGYNLRFTGALKLFREWVREQRVGPIHSIHCDVGQDLPSWRPGMDYRESVSARADLGGGVLLELSHEFDYLRWVFGEIAWIGAVLGQSGHLEIDVEDTAFCSLGFAGTPSLCSLRLDFTRRDHRRCCLAIGPEGTLRWNGISNTVSVLRDPSEGWQEVASPGPDVRESLEHELAHFLDCVQRGGQPSVTGHDGLAALRVVDAARASWRQRAIVEL